MNDPKVKPKPAKLLKPDSILPLRQRVEARLRSMKDVDVESLSPNGIKKLIHDLQLLQMELTIQNEDLCQAKEELAMTRSVFIYLYNFAPVGYITLSEAGLILDANLKVMTLMGLTRHELIQHPLTPFILSEDQGCFHHFRTLIFESGLPQRCEVRILRKDAPPFWAQLEANAPRDAQGTKVFQLVITDISERKKDESKLSRAYEELEKTIEKRTAELSVVNAALTEEIAERKRIESVLRENEALFKLSQRVNRVGHYVLDVISGTWSGSEMLDQIFGITKNETRDLDCFLRVIHPEHQREVIALLNSHIFNEGNPFDHEYRIYNAIDNSVHWVHGIGNVERDDEGRAIKMFGTIQDITERKAVEMEKVKLEAQYQQLRKAESLGRMAGAISHKFNNLLSIVIGNVELAMGELPYGSEAGEFLTDAFKAASNAADVTRMMLSYLGQTPGRHQPQDFTHICQEHLNKLQESIPHGIAINAELPKSGLMIHANKYQIEQLVMILATNAWEALGDDQGTIHLTLKTVSPRKIPKTYRFPLDWKPQDTPYACLEISDNGCGIAPEDISHIFDPFFTSKVIGRGLGLSVALGVLRAHNGAITVESQPGGGSVFRAFLPLSSEEVSQPLPQTDHEAEDETVGTILLVEDEQAVRHMAKTMLTRMGFSVIEAKDGIEAVELFQENLGNIRCVLSDLSMPRMDGWETLTALRKIDPDIPVILSSGYDQTLVMAGEHPEWPQAYLSKPYQVKKLREVILDTLKKSRSGESQTTTPSESSS